MNSGTLGSPRLARVSASLRASAWLGLTLVLLAAGVVRWSNAGSGESFPDAQLACAVGAALLALLALGYTLRGRLRSALAAGAFSVAALGGWVLLLFLG